MTVKDGMIMRKVAGVWVVVATGATAVDFGGMLTLNGSGAFLWNHLRNGATEAELVDALLEEYSVERPTAETDVGEFLNLLRDSGCLNE